ncbi:MAG: hypothetical protein N2202_05845 [Proteobacteria bacterium]|nr:hypothetical protein [Pseudomonadota bacterium]
MKKVILLIVALLFALQASIVVTDVRAQEVKDEKATQEKKEVAVEMPIRDIEDIPIPSKMKMDKSNTFLFEAKGIKVGILTYKGRVDSFSLAEAVKNNMLSEKWRLINALTYKNTINLNFAKGERTCNVFIEEGWFSTTLEVRVGVLSGN